MNSVRAGATQIEVTSTVKLFQENLRNWRLMPFSNGKQNSEASLKHYWDNIHASESSMVSAVSGEFLWSAAVRRLSWDSDFFGKNIGKIEPFIADNSNLTGSENFACGLALVDAILRCGQELDLEQMTTQVHAVDSVAHSALEAKGFKLADTIVSYLLNLNQAHISDYPTPDIRLAKASDIPALATISARCFTDRSLNVNRFNGDSFFSEQLVGELYATWLKNSIDGHLADFVLVSLHNNEPVGFVTVKKPSVTSKERGFNVASIPLNAVAIEHQGVGHYRALVNSAINALQREGLSSLEIKTQLPNLPVHACWQRLGARINSVFHTFRWSKELEACKL